MTDRVVRRLAWQLTLENGREVALALEPSCWLALDAIARTQDTDWINWVRRFETMRSDRNGDLASAVRVALVHWYRERCLPQTRTRRVAVRGPGRPPVMVPMETGLWDALAEIAHTEGESLNSFCWRMGKDLRREDALSSRLRDFVLRYLMQRAEQRAGAGE